VLAKVVNELVKLFKYIGVSLVSDKILNKSNRKWMITQEHQIGYAVAQHVFSILISKYRSR
jgi:hypothetical protein